MVVPVLVKRVKNACRIVPLFRIFNLIVTRTLIDIIRTPFTTFHLFMKTVITCIIKCHFKLQFNFELWIY
eukprot:UN26709